LPCGASRYSGAEQAAVTTTGASNDNLTAAQSALIAAQTALASQQTAYLQTQVNPQTSINNLADRFTNSINSLGVLEQNIGNTHTQQFAEMIAWLSYIAQRPQPSSPTLWSFLGFAGGGRIPGYDNGGLVGNGIYGIDSVCARYAGGGDIALAGAEYVMPAAQTRANLPQLEAMRSSGASNDNAIAKLGQHLVRVMAGVSIAEMNNLRESHARLEAKFDRLIRAVEGNKPQPMRPGSETKAKGRLM
jgi:hypothetical protein